MIFKPIFDDDFIEFINSDEEALIKQGNARPSSSEVVIAVRNVSMNFKMSSVNTSGIKEYIIQKIKGNVKHRELRALSNISFTVFKGEVIGIIGSNGSGKSTLLRIISGALNPTSGKVIVDKNKIQILTLGTGFDMELTAQENVYLNGAIIGYTKEFIDKHYDEIVDFAGLRGFMDQKVKNFSSGMVSRLGFAIATVGDAAEILILDEILSVGDEYFRNKSLARIKEMIHGGSTVLMVSHSLNTIVEHCSKVIWIEKGKIKMIGKPKEVCDAYRKMSGENKDKSYVGAAVKHQPFTGLVMRGGEWLYLINDRFAKEYTGLVPNVHGQWYVKEGKIDVGYTGDIELEGKTYKVVRGKVSE